MEEFINMFVLNQVSLVGNVLLPTMTHAVVFQSLGEHVHLILRAHLTFQTVRELIKYDFLK
jgi:hypothetical protein